MEKRLRISTGSPFEQAAAYSRAVRDGNFVYVAGTTGYDYATMTMPDDVTAQTQNCLDTVEWSLRQCGADLADVVRARYYVANRTYIDDVFGVVGKRLAGINPAATMIICELVREEMKIEIEVTARLR